jgi:hypothetical protein
MNRAAWAKLPPRRIMAVIVEPRGRVLKLECGHSWQTRRMYVVGQRIRCSLCSATASSTTWTMPSPSP